MSKDQLIDNLWADADIEKATRQLHNGIYHIRKALDRYGVDRSQINISGAYCLHTGDIVLDVEEFDQWVVRNRTAATAEGLEFICGLYTGDYFENSDWSWAEAEKVRLWQSYIDSICKLSETCISQNEFKKPEAYLNSIYIKNPYEEDVSELLIKLYLLTGNKAKAKRHYLDYAVILKEELGIKPPKNIQKMVENL